MTHAASKAGHHRRPRPEPDESYREDIPTSRKPTARHDSIRVFDLLVQPLVGRAESLAIDDAWRKAITLPGTCERPLLRVYELAGDVLSLGRFHAVPERLASDDPKPHRRHSGGRCVPFGEGFVGLSIVLAHRSALVADDPFVLTPAQVLNRCVRGILSGLKSAGIPAFYPGRDWVTVDRRIIGMISFDVGAQGGMIFEAVLSRSRDFSMVGTLSNSRLGPRPPHLETDEVTSLKRELGVEPTPAEIADMLAQGYATEFGISFSERDAPPASLKSEIQTRVEGPFSSDSWVNSRCVRYNLDHRGSVESLLGSFDAYCSLGPGEILTDVLLAGDIIANPAGIEDLERRLRGCPARRSAIDAVISEVFLQPENFVLGLPDPSSIATTICAGLSLRK